MRDPATSESVQSAPTDNHREVSEMSLPTTADLEALQRPADGPCISVYMPVQPKGQDTEQDAVRFKGLVDTASKELAALGLRSATIDAVLRPARDLAGDRPFWSRAEKAIAMFLALENGRILNLPFSVPELVVTGDRFHLRPLVFGLQPDIEYYVLTLGRHGAELLAGSRRELRPVPLRGVPERLEEIVAMAEEERPFQARTAAREGPRSTLVYHGHGGERDDDDERLREYFRAIDAGVQQALNPTQAPLILAGIEYLIPLYRQVSRYAHVVDQAIDINPDTMESEALRDLAWAAVEPRAQALELERRTRLAARAARDDTAVDLESILAAAAQGRVEAVFVAADAIRWGKTDATLSHLQPHDVREPGDEDFLDRAVLETLRTGGAAYSLEPDQMPRSAEIAALFRY